MQDTRRLRRAEEGGDDDNDDDDNDDDGGRRRRRRRSAHRRSLLASPDVRGPRCPILALAGDDGIAMGEGQQLDAGNNNNIIL